MKSQYQCIDFGWHLKKIYTLEYYKNPLQSCWRQNIEHLLQRLKSILQPSKTSETQSQSIAVSICTWFLKCQFGSLLQSQKKIQFRNKLDFLLSSNLIFTACVACKNQFRNQIDFFKFLNLIFRNWKKIEWHLIFQKSSGNRQGDWLYKYIFKFDIN